MNAASHTPSGVLMFTSISAMGIAADAGVGRGHNTGGRRHGDEASAREVARSFLMPSILFLFNWIVHLSLLQAMRLSRFGAVGNFRTELNSDWSSGILDSPVRCYISQSSSTSRGKSGYRHQCLTSRQDLAIGVGTI